MKCKLYCRGSSCRYCTWKPWSEDQQAIEGLYSSWITPDILAMARPTKEAIDKFDIIKQFKEYAPLLINLYFMHFQEQHCCCVQFANSGKHWVEL